VQINTDACTTLTHITQVSIVEYGSLTQFEVEGTTYAPSGSLLESDGAKVDAQNLTFPAFTRLAEIASLCNDAKVAYSEKDNSYTSVGEPTEAALRVLVETISSSAVNLWQPVLLAYTCGNAMNACCDIAS
jgi:Ca2+ transporting ATPase